MGLVGGLIALAVWGKLRFVSDVPRMAYADPKEIHPDASNGADRSGRDPSVEGEDPRLDRRAP